jgi:hypothetical protein
MPNVQFKDAISVNDIAALKAVAPADRADKSLRIVVAPGNNLPPTWYQFDGDSTFSEMLPGIVAPTTGTGRWIMVGTPIYFASDIPNAVPPLAGMRWVFGFRVWESIGTQFSSQWIELSPSSVDGLNHAGITFTSEQVDDGQTFNITTSSASIPIRFISTGSYRAVYTIPDTGVPSARRYTFINTGSEEIVLQLGEGSTTGYILQSSASMTIIWDSDNQLWVIESKFPSPLTTTTISGGGGGY